MYILTRRDLPRVYSLIQGSHALAQYMIEHTQLAKEWNNYTIVFLDVNTEEKMNQWIDKLDMNNIPFSKFNEPDVNDELTAIACYTDNNKLFKQLQVAK